MFFILSLFTGVFDGLQIIQFLYVLLISFFLIPIYYDHMPRKWNANRKIRTHLVFSFSVIVLLQLGYYFRLGVMKVHAYDYRFGHQSGPFRVIYSTVPFQYVIQSLYHATPLAFRIGLYQKEDVTRISRIESDVDSDFTRMLLCYEKDRPTCFLEVMKSSATTAPTGTAGTLALYEKGASFIHDEEILFPENHSDHVKQSKEFLRLIVNLSTNPQTDINHFVPGFPEKLDHPELAVLVKNEKKQRFLLAHKDPVVREISGRRIAGKKE